MPRTARAAPGGLCQHVINRTNDRSAIFRDSDEYLDALNALDLALKAHPIRLLAFCFMPNHFHFVVQPFAEGDLGRFMHDLMTRQVVRYCRKHGKTGRVWQGRFKAFPIQEDRHLLTVLRYVERNPLRAGLVDRAEDWPWSSLIERIGPIVRIAPPPVELPANWANLVNTPLTQAELDAIRLSLKRGRPFGDDEWVRANAERLGLESSLRPPGRPRRTRGR